MVLSFGKAAGVSSPVSSTVGDLRFFVAGLGSSLGVGVPPLPRLPALGDVKEFCSGLLENPAHHPWGMWWKGLDHTKAFSFAHSLFLFRKVIPALGDPDHMSDEYVRRMCRSSTSASSGLLEFVTKEITRMFQPGWDRCYRGRASGLLLPVKACLEAGRRRGGGRSRNKELPYLRRVALGWERIPAPDVRARVGTVKDGCKNRVVTTSSIEQVALKPLHDLLYDRLSEQDWLLRGDANPRAFRNFKRVDGEVFVSGDYESATDNLSLEVYQCVIRSLSGTTSCVPQSVWDLALSRSEAFIYSKRVCGVQRRGQLMGTFLSFPILCLVNYLTFKWLIPRDIPVMINGDDIVFRSTEAEMKVWKEGVGASGLVLSKGKTLVNSRFFTLNSTPFRAEQNRVRAVPFVRAKALFTVPDSPSSWAGQYSSLCPGFSGPSGRPWRLDFLRRHQRTLWFSQRSITRGLGVSASEGLLRQAGLLRRERFYLSFDKEESLPACLPDVPMTRFPSGFQSLSRTEVGVGRRRWAAVKGLEKSFLLACRLHAAGPVSTHSSRKWEQVVQRGTYRFWEPGKRVRAVFERSWRRLCLPFAAVKGPERVVERLMLPVEVDKGKRSGVGSGRRLALVDELW
jgi:hypothetical protein